MQLQFENKADIPSGEETDFVEFEQDGKQIYMHKDLVESKKTGYRLQGQVTNLEKDFTGFKSKIDSDKVAAQELARKDREEALAAKVVELRGSNEHAEAHKLEMQSASDKYELLVAANKSLDDENTGLKNAQVAKDNLEFATTIAVGYTTSKGVKPLAQAIVANHIKNIDGKPVFVNASGDAVDNHIDRYRDVLNNSDLSFFEAAPGSLGGHVAKGGGSSNNSGKWADYTPTELSAILRTDPNRYETLKLTR